MLEKIKRLPFFLGLYAEGDDNNDNGNDNKDGADNKGGNPPPKVDPKPNGDVAFEDLIKKARQEEKDKLYPQITQLKEKNNNLLLVIGERDKTIKELEEKVKGLEKDLESAKTEGNKSKDKEVSELRAEVTSLTNKLTSIEESHKKQIETLNVENLRIRLIAEAGNELIPELVTGNTEEEIKASITKSQERYKAIAGGSMGVRIPNPATLELPNNLKSEDIQRMSPKDYAKNREELLKSIRG
jgi:chromosome segregation ATPase